MRTIIQVHIFVRIIAIGLITLGLYRIAQTIVALNQIRNMQERGIGLMGHESRITDMLPTFMEMIFAPIIFVVAGTLLFVFVKNAVRFIIGSEQMETLMELDEPDSFSGSRPPHGESRPSPRSGVSH